MNTDRPETRVNEMTTTSPFMARKKDTFSGDLAYTLYEIIESEMNDFVDKHKGKNSKRLTRMARRKRQNTYP